MKKVFALFIIGVLMLGIFGCSENPSKYTIEEHIQRISSKIQTKSFSNFEFTNFEVFPLYDQNENVILYLVEFTPVSFMFVTINDDAPFVMWVNNIKMYSYTFIDLPWRRFAVSEYGVDYMLNQEKSSWPDDLKEFEIDDNGNPIFYDSSFWSFDEYRDEKKYILTNEYHYWVPAVKDGDDWLNLLSLSRFTSDEFAENRNQPDIEFGFQFKGDYL